MPQATATKTTYWIEATRVYSYKVRVPINATDEERIEAYAEQDPLANKAGTYDERVVREEL